MWGRFGAWLGRATAAVTNTQVLRLQVYVDDPLFTLAGSQPGSIRELGFALLFAAVAGFPLAWAKTLGGSAIQWIGALIRIKPGVVIVTVPEAKVAEIVQLLQALAKRGVAPRRGLRSLVGKSASSQA